MGKKVLFVGFIFISLLAAVFFLITTKVLQFKEMEEVGGDMAKASKLTKEAQALMAEAKKLMKPPPESVSTSLAELQTWPQILHAIGSIKPVKGVRLDAEVSGIVNAINFENGQKVSEGDVLVQLDIAPEAALLKSNKANAQLAKIELERAQRLRDTDSVAQSELDRAQANYDMAEAQVKNIEAVIDQKTIRAPFTGHVGIRQINLGQFLAVGSPIVTLQSYDTVFANFTLPQKSLGQVKPNMKITFTSDAYPDRQFEGKLTAISPQVDPVTRTIELQATLQNPDGLLRSGLFVDVTVTLSEDNKVLAIPATTIVYAPYGNSIFKVLEKEDEKTGETITIVKQSFIRIGERKGDFVSILEGLEEGDEVVSAGAFKLRNGMPVSIKNDLAPSPELEPIPDNS